MAVSRERNLAAGGGLLPYGPERLGISRRAAAFVDRILTGAKPADLPLEEATPFALTVTLTTARAIGRTLSPAVLARADEVLR